MSMNKYQRVVCFALSPTSIAVAGFASAVCKLQSRFTNTSIRRPIGPVHHHRSISIP